MAFVKPSNTQKNNLNRNSRAYPSLGDVVQNAPCSGSSTVTSAQASASAITIQTQLTTVRGKIVQATRSGSDLSGVKVLTSGSNLNITSASPTLWVIAENDVINYSVW
jgi:hypothetical protein